MHLLKYVFSKGQPNGADLLPCAEYNTDGGKYHDSSCQVKSCYVCAWNHMPVFTLRGLCGNTQLDSKYILRPEITYDGNVFFYGIEMNNIIFNKAIRSWLIVEDKMKTLIRPGPVSGPNTIVGTFQLDKFSDHYMPVGTHLWNITDRCNNIIPLKLTQVSVDIT